MPTKSGRIKLEDLCQGKTFWLACRANEFAHYKPQPFFVTHGAKPRIAALREVDSKMYAVIMQACAIRGPGMIDSNITFFNPDRNCSIKTSADGSFYHANAFTTRRRCQRHCDELNREQFSGFLDNIKYTPYVKYDGNYAPPIAPWEEAPAVPGGVSEQS